MVREKTVTWVRLAPTRAGGIGLAASEKGLILSTLPGVERLPAAPPAPAAAKFRTPPGNRGVPSAVGRLLDRAERALVEYYSYWPEWPGEEMTRLWAGLSDLPVDLGGLPSFSRRVLLLLRGVPPSMVVSYGALAARAGSLRAARAVGAVLARNPLPIILPCHRVIAADGTLGGFSGGRREAALRLKESLLRYEGWTLARGIEGMP